MAVKQIVAEHISGIDVIDIYAEAGMGQPDLSLIDEDLIDKFRYSDRPNRQIEMLKRLLADEIKAVGKRNLVAGQAFSGMLRRRRCCATRTTRWMLQLLSPSSSRWQSSSNTSMSQAPNSACARTSCLLRRHLPERRRRPRSGRRVAEEDRPRAGRLRPP